MKRCKLALRRLIIFGLLGVVMSYVVAWTSAYAIPKTLPEARGSSIDPSRRWQWRMCADSLGRGWCDLRLQAWLSHPVPRDAWEQLLTADPHTWGMGGPDEPIYQYVVHVEARGWPCVSHAAIWHQQGQSTFRAELISLPRRHRDNVLIAGIELPHSMPRSSTVSQNSISMFLNVLPTRIVWPGLLINTAFYGGLLWLLRFGPGIIRRGVRRQRGLCVRCGYDLRGAVPGGHGAAPCPECGGTSR